MNHHAPPASSPGAGAGAPAAAPAEPALSPLKRAFLALEQAEARLAAAEAARREPIAIVGLACRVPGADDAPAMWRLLRDGVDAVGPVPAGRFDLDAAWSPEPDAVGRSATREAGFLAAVDGFDAPFFGIARREAHGMDPQQRLLLEVSWEALEHAAQPPDRLSRSATGVYFGVCSNDYANLQLQAGDPSLLDAHHSSGIAHSVASGRIAYVLGLQGPAITIDTACSSSLVAVHLACQALRAGDCRMALAGGVNLMLSPDLFVAFSQTRMLAPDGRCKTFDAAADGFGRGEGCGVVVLKRLSQAQADGDRVLAVIRGSAVNQDGPSSGLTAPNGPAQEAVIRAALAHAGLQPQQVGYVEAHGTGTALGDPLEVQALGAVFGPGRAVERPLCIGSVKTNVGHLEAAAGITGIIKLVLALRERALPPHLHLTRPSPHIPWADLPLRVPTTLEPWEPIDGRRIGGVSSFGFSGTNAHVVIEEAPADAADTAADTPSGAPEAGAGAAGAGAAEGAAEGAAAAPCLFVLSAFDRRALAASARRHAEAFEGRADAELFALCRLAAVSRATHAERATVLARSMTELRQALQALAEGQAHPALRTARVTRRDPARIAFLFTGQGAQYAGMARELDAHEPVFRAALDRCAAVLDGVLEQPLRQALFAAEADSPLHRTAFTQPALFAVEFALAELWRSWGVVPDVVIGHSVGELAAACVAGALPLDDALRLVAERGRLMQSLPAGGAMAAISGEADRVTAEVTEAIEASAATGGSAAGTVAIAAVNAPGQVVVSGAAEEVARLCDQLAARGLRCQPLTVSHAFHSPLVDPVLDRFEAAAARVSWQRPQRRVISNLTGQAATADTLASPRYWRRHMREAVRFADGARTLAGLQPDLCLEVGPHPTLLAFTQEAFADRPEARRPTFAASLRRGRADSSQLAEALASAWLAGVAIDWRAVWSASPAPLPQIDLPAYPFQRERCWFRAGAGAARRTPDTALPGRATGHPLLGQRLSTPLRDVVQFQRTLAADDLPFVRDHRVHGRCIVPATGYIEAALAAGRQVLGEGAWIRDLVIAEPLAFEADEARTMQIVLRPREPGVQAFELLSAACEGGQHDANADAPPEWRLHAQGTLVAADAADADFSEGASAAVRREELDARCDTAVDAAAHLAQLAAHGLEFGPSLHGLRSLRRRDGEAVADIELPAAADEGITPTGATSPWLIHPALLDACLQALAAALPTTVARGRAFLPLAIDRVRRLRAPGRGVWSHVLAEAAGGDTVRAVLRVHDASGPVAELEGLVLRPAATSHAAAAATPFYEIEWPPLPGPVAWPSPADLAGTMAAALAPLAAAHDLDAHGRATQALDQHVAARVLQGLGRLGWQPRAGDRFDTTTLAARLGVAPRHRGAFARLLQILSEEGLLQGDAQGDTQGDVPQDHGAGWTVAADADTIATRLATALSDENLLARHPGSAARLTFVRRCGDALPSLLRGEVDPLHLLFPAGDSRDAEALYREAPEARVYNAFLRDSVVQALAQRPPGQPLRVLEVGAGTGGTTTWLAPALPEAGTDYLFTDLGAALVARAREHFAAHRFMRFQTLDLEQDLGAQGIAEGSVDLIVAANCIHATADLRRTLGALRSRLAPGGLLLMMEITARERWVDLSFGLTEGWWRFTDSDLRRDYPLLERPAWLRLLAELGFEAAALNPEHPGSSEVVLAARRPVQGAVLSDRWVVLDSAQGQAADARLASDLAAALAQSLAQRGAQVDLVAPNEALGNVMALRERLAGAAGVVHLGPLAASRCEAVPAAPSSSSTSAVASTPGPAAEQQDMVEPVLATVQALAGASHIAGREPALWVATRGAVAVGPEALPCPGAASTWGLGRVAALEHAELKPRWVDLDPGEPAHAQAEALADLIAKMHAAAPAATPQAASSPLAPPLEREFALRHGQCRVSRLVRSGVEPLPARPLSLRLMAGSRGVLDDLALQPAERRAPGPGEIEIRVLAAGLNFRDVMNAVAMRTDPEPLGGECAGRVTAVGAGVSGFAVGDAVVAVAEGCFATHATCDARLATALPATMSHADAVTLPFAAMTALHALVDLGALAAHHTVLVHAAAGGVGSAAVQIAQRTGATVIATAGSERKRAHLRAQGVPHVLDSRSTAFADEVLALTGGRGVDRILNSLAGDFIAAGARCLAAGGVFLEIGKRDIWDAARFAHERARWPDPGRFHAIDLNAMRLAEPEAFRALFRRAMHAGSDEALRPLPLQAFPLAKAAEAFRFMAQARHIGKVVLTQWDDAAGDDGPLPAHATMLITGGLSGLGLATAGHLVERGARHLLLAARSAPSPEVEARLATWRARGVEVRVAQADVSLDREVRRLVALIDAEMPPLRGVIHAAGVLADAALLQQGWPRFAEVLAPKVQGAWALHQATRHRPLDFFVLYASVASVFGSAGQANHAAANAFLDALAAHRRALGLPALSIGWGAWSEIGSAAGRRLEDRVAAKGVEWIAPAAGIAMLDRLMRGAPAHVAACLIDWERLFEAQGAGSASAFLAALRPQRTGGPGSPGGARRPGAATEARPHGAPAAAEANAAQLEALRQATPARRADLMLAQVADQVARVLGAGDGQAIDPQQPLNELGMDSLMSVELRNRLTSAFALARSLPATLVFDHPTIEALARHLLGLLFGDDAPAPAPAAAAPAADAVQAIDELSDEQIEALFARRTAKT